MHTPGPWRLDGSLLIVAQARGRANKSDLVAGCYGEAWGLPEAEANARLIAAAPELQEALQRFVDLSDAEYLGDDPRAVHAVKVARAAIAKVEGQ